MAEFLTGGCLCGAVRYRCDSVGGELGLVTLCHCGTCRRLNSFACAAAPTAGFVLEKGEEVVREYESSAGKFRVFCGVCGAPVYSRREAKPEAVRVRLGSLDRMPEGVRIEAHIYVEDVPGWADPGSDVPRYPGVEPERK